MIAIPFERLRPLGLTPALARLATTLPGSSHDDISLPICPAELRLARLIEVHRDSVRLHDGEAPLAARVLPALARALELQRTALAVGDWTLCAGDVTAGHWVHRRVPPVSHIARRDADGRRHPVVSNVDAAVIVMGLDDDFNLRRLERYLALVHGSGVTPVVVLSKADVLTHDALERRLDALRDRLPGIDVLALDGRDAVSVQRLEPHLGAGRTLVLLGSSGAGKSTLTNTLLGVFAQDTGPVRGHDSRGKHTTTSRSLHCLPGGACIIDTPGLRALRPDVDEATLAASFGDIEQLASSCRYRDCRHADEPGCAVRAGVDADRVRNYHKLLRESRRDTLDPLQRRQQLAMWKSRGRAARERLRHKRGEG